MPLDWRQLLIEEVARAARKGLETWSGAARLYLLSYRLDHRCLDSFDTHSSVAECVWLPWWCGSACLLEALGVGVQTPGSVFGDQ
jgi:hypothetical protein